MACRQIMGLHRMALSRLPLQFSTSPVTCAHNFFGRHADVRLVPCRFESTEPNDPPPSKFVKLRRMIGLTDYPSALYRTTAVLLYEKVDQLPVKDYFEEFQLEDTFYSWFLVMELHFWMLLSTASKFEKEGKIMKDMLSVSMWDDVRRRIKLLVNLAGSDFRKTLNTLHEEMSFALVLYDEAIRSDDKRLSEAVWLRLYGGKDVDPQNLEKLVCYIRKQVLHLDSVTKEDFATRGYISWLPLKQCIA